MKILKIAFKNIHSLRGEHAIDFTQAPFTQSSLFAITGPTGSGKSTLLDVIALALFNQVPRFGKISNTEIISKGAILTRNQKDAYAEVTYECKSGVFRSVWEISTNRNGNLRDYNLEVFDVDGQKIDLKKSEVPAKNEELIGLNYDQFIKSVLLAQGEFAQFLKAKKEERGELLEKITGTGIYRELGILAFEKNKLVNRTLEEQQQSIKTHRESLLEAEDLKISTQKNEKQSLQLEKLKSEHTLLTKAIDLKKELAEQEKQLHNYQQQEKQALQKQEGFQEKYGQDLTQHEKVTVFAEELRRWKNIGEQTQNLTEEKKQLQEKLNAAEEKSAAVLKKASAFTQTEVNKANLAEKVNAFAEKIAELQQQRTEKGKEWKSLKELLKTEIRVLKVSSEDDSKVLYKKLRGLQESSATKQLQTEKLLTDLSASDFKNLEETSNRFRSNLKQAREAEKFAERQNRFTEEIKVSDEEIKKITEQLKPLPEQISKAEIQLKDFEQQKTILQQEKENKLLRADLETHRKKLEDGKACPLCGSIHHPYQTEALPEDDELEANLKRVEAEKAKHQQELITARTQQEGFQNRIKEVEKQQNERKNALEELVKTFSEKTGNAEISSDIDWEKEVQQLENKLDALVNWEQEKVKLEALDKAFPIIENLEKTIAKGSEISDEISQLYSGNDVRKEAADLQNNFIRLGEETKNILESSVEKTSKLKTLQQQQEALETELKNPLQDAGFETLKLAEKALLPESISADLYKRRDSFQKELDAVKTTLALLQKQQQEKKEKDVPELMEVLSAKKEAKEGESKKIQEENEALRRVLFNHTEAEKRIQSIQAGITEEEKQNKRWQLLNELIGDARGKKFNDFAQDLTLSQLIVLANKRLVDLTDRYQIDKPLESEDDGLVVIDEHMGGQRRSVKTLSGGETFILSLSMALALSDLASRNIEINSLFIDEGFGTLDPETLDQTLDTLEKLQAESEKTIGIISHVASLKERIGTQVQLTRNGQGYSSLTIVG